VDTEEFAGQEAYLEESRLTFNQTANQRGITNE